MEKSVNYEPFPKLWKLKKNFFFSTNFWFILQNKNNFLILAQKIRKKICYFVLKIKFQEFKENFFFISKVYDKSELKKRRYFTLKRIE